MSASVSRTFPRIVLSIPLIVRDIPSHPNDNNYYSNIIIVRGEVTHAISWIDRKVDRKVDLNSGRRCIIEQTRTDLHVHVNLICERQHVVNASTEDCARRIAHFYFIEVHVGIS